ncbi:MAG: SoxR reducing system RseC family protein [Candidatus Arsenophonus melophagi]|nr:SoxR reducing system RseC family protein [Candidatus Arsenophonus melophagi]
MKEQATVVHWHNGRTILQYNLNFSCRCCVSHLRCGSYFFNKIGSNLKSQLELEVKEPLVAGQKVEIGIKTGSLLCSAILVYFSPLLGLFVAYILMNFFFLNQLIIFLSTVFGASVGFFLAKKLYNFLLKNPSYYPTIFLN